MDFLATRWCPSSSAKLVKNNSHFTMVYGTLWLFNIAMGNGPFIDGLPTVLKMVIFHGYVK